MKSILVVFVVCVWLRLHVTVAEPPLTPLINVSSPTVTSITTPNTSGSGPSNAITPPPLKPNASKGKETKGKDGKAQGSNNLKPYFQPPGQHKRQPFWRSRKTQPQNRPRQEERPQPIPTTPDPVALTNFLAAAAFLLQNHQLQLRTNNNNNNNNNNNKLNNVNNQPHLPNSISSQAQQQQPSPPPLVGPFSYSQMSNVYNDGEPIPSKVFSSISLSGPSIPSFGSHRGPTGSSFGSSHSSGSSGPSTQVVSFGPSGGFSSARLPSVESHYTNPNTSPYQPSSIATSFFSKPPPPHHQHHNYNNNQQQQQQQAQRVAQPHSVLTDYEVAKSHYHPATVALPNSSSASTVSTAASNLSPQTYTVTGPSASAPGSLSSSIQYITPTPHKPYAVTFEPGFKPRTTSQQQHSSTHTQDTNQVLSTNDYFLKLLQKAAKNIGFGALPPDQFLKTISLIGGGGESSLVLHPLSSAYATTTATQKLTSDGQSPSAPASTSDSFSISAISSLEEKMNLLLNLVPHLVNSGALPLDSVLAPALQTNKYVLPQPSAPASALFLKQQHFLDFLRPDLPLPPSAPRTPSSFSGIGLSNLEPDESAYYSPSASSAAKVLPPTPFIKVAAAAAAPSFPDFDVYDMLANPSSPMLTSAGAVRGPPSSTSSGPTMSDPVILYHHSSTPSGHHPFAPPPPSLLAALNEDKPRTAIGSLLATVRKLIF